MTSSNGHFHIGDKVVYPNHGVGTIALGKRELRVAFSCLAEAQIPGVFDATAKAVRAVRGK